MILPKMKFPYYYFAFLVYPISLLLFYMFSDCSPYDISLDRTFLSPSFRFPLGTNELGQDIACMIGRGVITSLKVGGISALISFVLGTFLGIIAGYMRGIYDEIISRLIDFFQGFPSLIFVIFIVSFVGGGDINVIISLCVFGWTPFARISRAETMKIKEEDFLLSAKIIGVGGVRLIRFYILPFVLPASLTQFMFSFSAFILAEGALGFLGLRPEDEISLGGIISMEIDFILTHPHLVIYPGLALTCLSIFLNLVGQAFVDKER